MFDKIIKIFITVLIFFLSCKCNPDKTKFTEQQTGDNYMTKRISMIESQLKTRGIKDVLVLNAVEKVKRHLFVPQKYRSEAYNDEPLPIGYNQTISQPFIVAYMTQALHLDGKEKVLEIGTGSGYQAAVLAEIGCDVYTIEIIEKLKIRAEKILNKLGYNNIHCRYGDGYKGWPEQAPFDAIIVTAAPPEIPEKLVNQLAENGRMILPKGTVYQELLLICKIDGKIHKEKLLPVRFVPMIKK
ncbi:MAG: protein-L-isoaspartate(D-aspartate) O-methyltransferase [bacterium]